MGRCAVTRYWIRKGGSRGRSFNKPLDPVNKHCPLPEHHHPTIANSENYTTETHIYPYSIAKQPNMAYNGRMSMARTTQHNQRAPPASEHDAFMTLVCAQLPLTLRITNGNSPIMKSQAASQISESSLASQTCRSRIPRLSRRCSNGSPSYS
jgi:hypothetical protein